MEEIAKRITVPHTAAACFLRIQEAPMGICCTFVYLPPNKAKSFYGYTDGMYKDILFY